MSSILTQGASGTNVHLSSDKDLKGEERLIKMPLPIRELLLSDATLAEVKAALTDGQLPAKVVKKLPRECDNKGYATALRVVLKEATVLSDMSLEAYLGKEMPMEVDEVDELREVEPNARLC